MTRYGYSIEKFDYTNLRIKQINNQKVKINNSKEFNEEEEREQHVKEMV